MANVVSRSFNTGKVRFLYPHVFQKNMRQGDDEESAKYELTMLISKDDKDTLKKIKTAAQEIYEECKNSTFRGLEFEEVAKPYHDGDGRRPKGGAYADYCKGTYVLNSRSKLQAKVFDRDGNAVTDPLMIYSGCYGRVALNLYAYDNKGGKGIGCSFNGIKTYNFGETLGGPNVTADTFNDGFEDPEETYDDDLL